MRKLFATAIILLAFSIPAAADQLNLLGTWDITNYIQGSSQAISNYTCCLLNGYLYTAAGNGVFVVDTNTNKVVDNFPLYNSDYPWDIVANGNYLYVADYNTQGAVEIYDITNPTSVNFKWVVGQQDYANGIFVSGNYMYVADAGNGLVVDDITNIASALPNMVTQAATSYYSETVYVTGNASDGNNYAYLNDETGMQIINVSPPTAPAATGLYYPNNSGYYITCIYVANNLAYLGELNDNGQGQLEVVDVSNAASPVYVNSVATGGPVYNMTFYTGYLFLCEDANGVEAWDITTNPQQPGYIAYIPTNGYASSCAVNNNTIYVSDNYVGLTEVNISTLPPGIPVSYFDLYEPTTALSVKVNGNYAYIAGDAIGLLILDVTNPANPLFAGSLDLPSNAYDIYFDSTSNYVYLADAQGGLVVADATNPYAPVYVTGYATNDAALGVDKQGSYVYVAAYQNGGMEVFDLTNGVTNGFLGGTYPSDGGTMWKVRAGAGYAYVADDAQGMDIVNISTPDSPSFAGNVIPLNVQDGSVYDVNVNSTIAYLAEYPGYDQGLGVVDVTSSTAPAYYGLAETNGEARGVIYNTNYAYLACDTAGLDVFDASNPYYIPASPPVATLYLTGTAYNVYTNDGLNIYVADGEGGLDICQHIRPTITETPTISPVVSPTTTPTISPTPSMSATYTISATASPTPSLTVTPSFTYTPSMTPTFTYSSTYTYTPTFTFTSSASATYTITLTYTITPTYTFTPTQSNYTPTPTSFQLTNLKPYPNPCYSGQLNISYNLTQQAQRVTIKVYTQAYRLIFEADFTGGSAETNAGTDIIPLALSASQMANGLYFYVIEATGQDNSVKRQIDKFIALMK